MLMLLLRLPIEVLRIGFYALCGLADSLRGHKRLRVECTVLINAPRDTVWRLSTADRVAFEGITTTEIVREPLPGSDGLHVTRVSINGELQVQVVSRELERDEAKGAALAQAVPHELSLPPGSGNDCLMGFTIEERPQGTGLTLFNELTVRSFRERISYPLGLRRLANLIKQQCEKGAGTQSWASVVADHWLLLSFVALWSFWYLVGWQDALILAAVVILHEAGHAVAMRLVGIEVRGIYLIPFFGGAVLPKTSYRTQGNLAFVALMGPGFSLIPTLGLAAMLPATGDPRLFLEAAWLFALINVSNLLPVYPLDGGLILNALLGSLSSRLAAVAGWIGVLAGLGLAIYWQSFLIGIPFMLFALQRYLGGGRTLELERLSLLGGTALVLTFITTAALYLLALSYTYTAAAAQWAGRLAAPAEVVLYVDSGLRSTSFVEPLLCALRRVLVAPVSRRDLQLPHGPDLAVTSTELDAHKVRNRFLEATAADASPGTFRYLLLGDDLKVRRRNVFLLSFGDETTREHAGLVSTARLDRPRPGVAHGETADILAQRAYKLLLKSITRVAGYRNPQGCILASALGLDELDRNSAEFCYGDRAALVSAGILKAEAGSGCPLVAQGPSQ
jgi:Zn-dependent protease